MFTCNKHIEVFFLAVLIYLPIITVILESILYLKTIVLYIQ